LSESNSTPIIAGEKTNENDNSETNRRKFQGTWAPVELHDAVENGSISGLAAWLAMAIASLASGKRRSCNATNRFLGKKINKSQRTVQQLLAELEAAKFLCTGEDYKGGRILWIDWNQMSENTGRKKWTPAQKVALPNTCAKSCAPLAQEFAHRVKREEVKKENTPLTPQGGNGVPISSSSSSSPSKKPITLALPRPKGNNGAPFKKPKKKEPDEPAEWMERARLFRKNMFNKAGHPLDQQSVATWASIIRRLHEEDPNAGPMLEWIETNYHVKFEPTITGPASLTPGRRSWILNLMKQEGYEPKRLKNASQSDELITVRRIVDGKSTRKSVKQGDVQMMIAQGWEVLS
jgi:hypothetical protein